MQSAPLRGMVFLYSGSSYQLLRTFTGVPFDALGSSLASVGDYDFDGVRDLALGAPSTFFDPSAPAARVDIVSGRTGNSLYVIERGSSYDGFATALAAPGDVNDDGFEDIAVGAPYAQRGGAGRGTVEIWSYVGLPEGSRTFAPACATIRGEENLLLASGGQPSASVGNPRFGLVMRRVHVGALSMLGLGASNTNWAGVSLPIRYDGFGVPCFWYTSIEATYSARTMAAVNGDGAALYSLPVPQDPALMGAPVFAQGAIFHPMGVFPTGALTQPIEIVLD